MSVEIMRPLLRIDLYDDIVRMDPNKTDPTSPKIKRLECPMTGRYCSYRCAFLTLVEDEEKPLTVLGCSIFGKVRALGVVDVDVSDQDQIENLRLGTDLHAWMRPGWHASSSNT